MNKNTADSSGFKTILGIKFFTGSLADLLELTHAGGLIVVPAAPALVELPTNHDYRNALERASFAIIDSSFLKLLWIVRKGEVLTRNSGIQYMRGLVDDPTFRRNGASFWVMPSEADLVANVNWLKSEKEMTVTRDRCYIAPHYEKGRIEDRVLLDEIERLKPQYVVLNIGGGTQEILGEYLASRLSYAPAIICTGAAIAILSGRQGKIHPWVDKLMLAWFARCLSEPQKFVPRYLRGFRLISLLFKYAERPVLPEVPV